MKTQVTRNVNTLACVGLLLTFWVSLIAQAQPPSLRLPGRKPDSLEPWGAFLGRAAHEAIGRQYLVQHPSHLVFRDTASLSTIVKDGELGDPKKLSEFVRLLRPDITDVQALVLFEIKPDTEEGRRRGREQAGRYLEALNTAVEPHKQLSGGTSFSGSLFLEFEDGGALWKLSWYTAEPGITLYRWSYRRKQSHSSWKERAAQKEEQLPEEEMKKHGELAEQAIRAAYAEGDWPNDFQGKVYLPVDCQ
jgi:hypothetical protein